MVNIKDIQYKLKKKGIEIFPQTLKLYGQQGAINEVFVIDSNEGKLLIQVGKKHSKKEQFQKAKRVYYLSQFFAQHPQIPTVEFLVYGKDSEGKIFTVQKFIEGKTYRQARGHLSHLKHLAQIMIRLHQIDMKGAGYIDFKNNKPLTTHKEWYSFLSKSSFNCLKHIFKAKKVSKKEYEECRLKLKLFFRKYKYCLVGIKGKLMHGDLTLGNVLMGDKHINAIIDLEFSCVGDPAWEFATHKYLQGVFLNTYFKELKDMGLSIDEDNFRFRIKIYDVIKQLVIANSLKENDKSFRTCWSSFRKLIDGMI